MENYELIMLMFSLFLFFGYLFYDKFRAFLGKNFMTPNIFRSFSCFHYFYVSSYHSYESIHKNLYINRCIIWANMKPSPVDSEVI